MNQLTPPPERDLSADRRVEIRRTLGRHLTSASRSAHPFRTPALAGGVAVGLAAVTMTGISTWSGDDAGGGPDRDPHGGVEPSVATQEPDRATLPDDPVRWCHRTLDDGYLTPAEAPDDPDFSQWPLRTGPTVPTPDGVIQVLVDPGRQWWWACDSTIGRSGYIPMHELDGSTLPRTNDPYNYALLSAPVDTADGPATYLWGVGLLPPGVDAVRFTFQDGHVENAVVEDGFWMVGYQADEVFPDDSTVTAAAGGKTFAVPWRLCVGRSGSTTAVEQCGIPADRATGRRS